MFSSPAFDRYAAEYADKALEAHNNPSYGLAKSLEREGRFKATGPATKESSSSYSYKLFDTKTDSELTVAEGEGWYGQDGEPYTMALIEDSEMFIRMTFGAEHRDGYLDRTSAHTRTRLGDLIMVRDFARSLTAESRARGNLAKVVLKSSKKGIAITAEVSDVTANRFEPGGGFKYVVDSVVAKTWLAKDPGFKGTFDEDASLSDLGV